MHLLFIPRFSSFAIATESYTRDFARYYIDGGPTLTVEITTFPISLNASQVAAKFGVPPIAASALSIERPSVTAGAWSTATLRFRIPPYPRAESLTPMLVIEGGGSYPFPGPFDFLMSPDASLLSLRPSRGR